MRQRAPRGLTLIELVAAMAIFALVAVMGAQGLSGMIRQRDALTRHSARAAELELATALLRADLSAALPMGFYPPGGGFPQSAARRLRGGFALTVGGQAGLDPAQPAGGYRVEYRIEPGTGRLLRRVWPTLMPAASSAASPERALLQDVDALTLRSYWGDLGWVDWLTPPDGAQPASAEAESDGDLAGGVPEVYSSTLPDAIELTLTLRDLGPVTLMESLR